MRSIRAKLFLSVGSIFLAIAILSYLVPHFFVRKDIDAASSYLTGIYNDDQKRIRDLSSSWISYRFVQVAAQLSAIAQTIPVEKKSPWETASDLLGQDPTLAIIQVTSSTGETAIISPESSRSYTPWHAQDEKGNLWIQMPEKQTIFLATPYREQKRTYLLTADPSGIEMAKTLSFIPFDKQSVSTEKEGNSQQMYAQLREQEGVVLEKAQLIQDLNRVKEKAVGILRVDSVFKKAVVLLTEEIFFTTPVIATTAISPYPTVVYRKEGPYVDLMEFVTKTAPYIAIGNSLSAIAAEIALTIKKPVLLYDKGELLQGFDPAGKEIQPTALSFNKGQILWNKAAYLPGNVTIGPLSFTVLMSVEQQMAIQNVLNSVHTKLIKTLSYNLFLLTIFLFGVAMVSLARISKRLAKPITQLAQASEEIGKGKYEGLDLPDVGTRDDEVAVLSHSFHQMAASLRDREKIRGVLNKVVSKEIASTILNSSIELGGEEIKLTMLFSDIRGFTPLSETLPPQKLISLLNIYMTRMCRIIDETHGVVDKFVGDEIMALYGAPLPLEHHAEQAIESAILMIADLKRWNAERGLEEPQIAIGIGIHTGEAFAGNMGAEDRLNYTVVGANVNLAARLCSAAVPMQILVSETTYLTLANPEKFHFQKLAPVTLKGIDTPVNVYEVL